MEKVSSLNERSVRQKFGGQKLGYSLENFILIDTKYSIFSIHRYYKQTGTFRLDVIPKSAISSGYKKFEKNNYSA